MAIAARYKGYRYPIEVIGHAVWLYHRFALSLRDVEELMLARGVVVSYETIRSWCAKGTVTLSEADTATNHISHVRHT